jgi:nucleoside-diphosphate-sugar epimerase
MIFITGASGLLGASLIETLVNSHDGATDLQIRALYRKQIPSIQFAEKIEWIEGDILDVVVLEEALKGVSEVYHCAAIVSFDPKQKQRMHATNIDGTANVVNACIDAGIKKLLFVSSVAALGRIREDGPINETMNWSEETSNISAQRFIISGHNTPYRTIFNLIADAFKVPRPYKRVTPLLASIVWRLEAVKAFFTGSSPLLTKETTLTAQAVVNFDNTKLLKALPHFSYTPLENTITRVVEELKEKYNLQ